MQKGMTTRDLNYVINEATGEEEIRFKPKRVKENLKSEEIWAES